jgi:hypothetical protein
MLQGTGGKPINSTHLTRPEMKPGGKSRGTAGRAWGSEGWGCDWAGDQSLRHDSLTAYAHTTRSHTVLLLSEPQGRADKRLGDKRKVERVESKHIVRNADGIPMARSAAHTPLHPYTAFTLHKGARGSYADRALYVLCGRMVSGCYNFNDMYGRTKVSHASHCPPTAPPSPLISRPCSMFCVPC